uniref:Uncharacterized protein n=1 Tax=Homalodisca liturata TaxID=320908 RepID=A0A1B6JHT5_9HEMI
MDRVGRGRSRGGRVLQVSELGRGMGHGKIMAGRGIYVVTDIDQMKSNIISDKTGSEPLEEQLSQLVKTETGCFIRITLDYFTSNSDTQYYTDKVMDKILKSRSSFMVEQVSMSFKLVTLLETYGEDIKKNMFFKLQNTFQDIQILMQDHDCLSEEERDKVRNVCELLGQLYFRFRIQLGFFKRYTVFVTPAIECMRFLLRLKGEKELAVLVKLVVLNYASLCEVSEKQVQESCSELNMEVRKALLQPDTTETVRTWLLCITDCIAYKGELLPELVKLYTELLGSSAIHTPPTHMLAEVPADLALSQAHMFSVPLDEYDKLRITPCRPQDG